MTDTTISATVNNQPILRDSLEQIRAEMAALGPSNLLQIHVDPLVATGIARGSLSRLMKYRDQLASEVPKFDLANLDKLGTYALGLVQAHTAYTIATAPPEAIASLAQEAAELYTVLFSDATALATRGLLNPAPLSELKGSTGHRGIASNVLGVALLLRNSWGTISTKSCVTMAELDRAEVIGQQLLDAVGLREQSPARLEQVALERQQAYTLFVNAYDQVRRAIGFLRWNEEDADDIAPSLYSGRNSPRKKTATDIDKQATTATATPAATVPVATTTTAAASAAKPAVGLPGADPFAN